MPKRSDKIIMLKEIIETLTTYGSMELPDYLKIADIKISSKRKADMVDALYAYLSKKENILDIWKCLIPMEKEIISEFIKAGGILDYKEVKEIIDKYTQETSLNQYGYGSGIHKYFYKTSKSNLLFIREKMPIEIYNILKDMVEPIEIKFSYENVNVDEYLNDEEEYNALISIGEDFEKDFISIIKLVNSSKFKATQASQMPNKTAMLKMNEVLIHKDIFFDDNISNVRIIDNTIRLYGISKLLLESNILQVESGNLILGEYVEDFLTMNIVEKCKFLLNAYIFAGVDELKRIKELKIKTDYYGNYANCRNLILNYLEKAPVDKWINIEQLLTFIKKLDRNFLTKEVGTIYTYSDYERYYYPDQNSWEEDSGRFVEVVLMEYLATIGMVDLLIKQEYNDDDIEYLKVTYFKLTPLGAHILGVNKDYKVEEIEDETGIIIQPNYEIIVQDGAMKDINCIYLDKVAEKLSEDTASIYKISFKSMVMALDNGISIEDIIDYFKEACKNEMPENVLMSLKEWNEKSKKIKIRKVTIVETDDKYLLEELKSYKDIKKDISMELPYVFEINSKDANKIKRNIEKKNHFCIIE